VTEITARLFEAANNPRNWPVGDFTG